ncbi:hypothetical protein B0H12DRAFT_760483 [Mycena haematopus]|nr:hypothetical protein B0H12DRAFT_760483 [Mycena haematopus]
MTRNGGAFYLSFEPPHPSSITSDAGPPPPSPTCEPVRDDPFCPATRTGTIWLDCTVDVTPHLPCHLESLDSRMISIPLALKFNSDLTGVNPWNFYLPATPPAPDPPSRCLPLSLLAQSFFASPRLLC